jgi:hypothetical protein
VSKITEVFDNLNTRLSAIYPSATYKKLVNPYILELNDTLSLNRGYGFYIGPGVNTRKLLGPNVTFEREVILFNTIVNRGTERDVVIRETAEKTLIEDQFLAIESFHREILSDAWDLKWDSDGGIEFVFTQQQNFLSIRSTYRLSYSEEC